MNDLRAFLVRAALDPAFLELVQREPERAFADYALAPEDLALLRRGDTSVLALVGRVLEDELAVPEAAPMPEEPAQEAAPAAQLPDLKFEVTISPTQVGHTLTYRAGIAPAGQPPGFAPEGTDPQWGHRLGSVAAQSAAQDVLAAAPEERRAALAHLVTALTDGTAEETVEAPPEPTGEVAIHVVGLGIEPGAHLTAGTDRLLRTVARVLYLDAGVATQELLEARCANVEALYTRAYEERGSRLGAYHRVAVEVLAAALEEAPVAFATQGHPSVFCYPPLLIRDAARLLGLRVAIHPAIGALDCLFAELGLDPSVHGLQSYEATDLLLRRRVLQPDVPLVLWQAGTVETRLHTRRVSAPGRFDRLKAWLLHFYPPSQEVVAFFSSPHPLVPTSVQRFPLAEMCERAHELHPGVTLLLPPSQVRPVVDLELVAALDSPRHLARITRG